MPDIPLTTERYIEKTLSKLPWPAKKKVRCCRDGRLIRLWDSEHLSPVAQKAHRLIRLKARMARWGEK